MAKTKEQVLAVTGLTDEQKKRAEDWFVVKERFNKTGKAILMPVNTATETKEFLNNLIKNYNKRKERELKNNAKKAAEATENAAIFEAITDAKQYGFTVDDIVDAIKNTVKERKNEQLRQKIAELQAQLEE